MEKSYKECCLVTDFADELKRYSKDLSIYIFGAGAQGKIYAKFLQKFDIKWKGFIDNNPKLWGEKIYEKEVVTVKDVKNKDKAFLIIALSVITYKNVIDEIKEQVIAEGFQEKYILSDEENMELFDEIVYYLSTSKTYLKKNACLKNIFQGQRCFIIGNGPSLNLMDLEIMKNEITMSCNGSIDLFEKTVWRPTCFFGGDSQFLSEKLINKNAWDNLLGKVRFVFTTLRSSLYKEYDLGYQNLYFLDLRRKRETIEFSEDICEKTFDAGTTLYAMIQVAVYMGISKIYLIGVDFSFKNQIDLEGKLTINMNLSDHMREIKQNSEGIYAVDVMLNGYRYALEYAKKNNIKIYNATRGGKLEVFERVDFNDLF